MIPKSFKVLLLTVMMAILVFPLSFIGSDGGSQLIQKAYAVSTKSQPLGSNIFVEIAKKQNPAVVNISTKTKRRARPPRPPRNPNAPGGKDPFQDFYDKFFGDRDKKPRAGMGSGFVIDKEGYILTNNHVIDGADEIVVLIEDGDSVEKEYDAKLIGTDSKTDIALIKLVLKDGDKKSFPALSLGDSDKLEVGEWVVAIGNPFGLSHTVTVGVVSAKERNIGSGPYDEFIQTDASINPGNSGGPLMNIKGEVIGINTAIISGNTGGNVGIGFAIPINVAKDILKDLKEKGTVTRGWLGVMIQKITPDLAESFNLDRTEGALVGDVIPNSPAEKAGIKRGDVIVTFDNEEVKTMEALPKIVGSTTPGKAVKVEVIRDGKKKVLDVTIAILKDEELKVAALDPVGIQVQDITPDIAQSLNLDNVEGVLVSDVTPGEPGGEAGLKRGDIISEVNRTKVKNTDDYNEITSKLKSGDTALMLVKRGGTTIYIAVKLK
ncbi:MAG TPA: DegQ family serine endoprotease [Desulfobacteria bacterium]|nr:DegQ family serine endoprotease [Desulfobacteria bacterium]